MARRNNRNRLLVPDSRAGMSAFRTEVLRREGYAVDPSRPNDAKYEVAQSIGVPLERGYNGGLDTEAAGRVGGAIGGLMVRELVKLAQQQLAEQRR
ncbi:alpha/beta-type small acid-soluble spore protein [Paenibacillus antri]|uniref:Alpha/beta-type small acid-soluble spore protein n=1 Tax=Paenibacillus antri TaxID=2582848 RepID=A0A5R9GA17_9BACL|nr:alpha/beta-type small acid-soluble spore protein [Paenibacillus antri]TLS50218.1 alpha/beta-type small acid-soluble spore protein [Paenibacillus antri]